MALTDTEKRQIWKHVDEDLEAGRTPEKTAEWILKQFPNATRTEIDEALKQDQEWNEGRVRFLEAWQRATGRK
jgi:hypothetical protein